MDELQSRMSYAEFLDWVAFAQVEPLPAARADLHTAMLMLMLYNAHKGKNGKKLKIDHFMPVWWKDRRDARNLEAKLRAISAQMNEEEEPEGESGRRTREPDRQAGA